MNFHKNLLASILIIFSVNVSCAPKSLLSDDAQKLFKDRIESIQTQIKSAIVRLETTMTENPEAQQVARGLKRSLTVINNIKANDFSDDTAQIVAHYLNLLVAEEKVAGDELDVQMLLGQAMVNYGICCQRNIDAQDGQEVNLKKMNECGIRYFVPAFFLNSEISEQIFKALAAKEKMRLQMQFKVS